MKEINFITKNPTTGENNTRLSIKQDGNVGIGTETPSQHLDINGDLNVTGDIKQNGVNLVDSDLHIKNIGDVPDIDYSTLGDKKSLIWNETTQKWEVGAAGLWQTNNDNEIYLETQVAVNKTTPTSGYNLDVSGNSNVTKEYHVGNKMGIGTNTPGYNLHVVGNTKASSWTTVSDNRIKHNEQSISSALETIKKIVPKHYFKTQDMYDAGHDFTLDVSGHPLNSEGTRLRENADYTRETGIIAQEVKDIPELTFSVKDGAPMSVDYNSIHCTHIAATKEMHASFKLLDGDSDTLKTDNEQMKQDIAKIKQDLGI